MSEAARDEGPPPWRRLDPRGGAARAALLAAILLAALALAGLVAAPLLGRIGGARERAAELDARSAALEAAAEARRKEALPGGADPAALAAAEAWLAEYAPRAGRDAAALDLLSTIRLLAGAAEVELVAAAPLEGAAARAFAPPAGAPVDIVAAEARLSTDHAGLARFLAAVEAARPALRAAALEIVAASPAVGREAEARRLSAVVLVGALRRDEE